MAFPSMGLKKMPITPPSGQKRRQHLCLLPKDRHQHPGRKGQKNLFARSV